MSTEKAKLRGNKARLENSWPLGAIPKEVIIEIGKQLVHRLAVGHADITGNDFGTIFANAIGGVHRESPLGIADVPLDGNAWSVKTIKAENPFTTNNVRVISGRNSPDYSLGIQNPHHNVNETGRAVLSIWNARVNEALGEYDDLRIAVFVRNMGTREFLIFEEDAIRFATDNFRWEENEKGNLEGFDKSTNEHKFTWQPHGSQFTIKRKVPGSAIKFCINKQPPIIEMEHVLRLARFDESWITIL